MCTRVCLCIRSSAGRYVHTCTCACVCMPMLLRARVHLWTSPCLCPQACLCVCTWLTCACPYRPTLVCVPICVSVCVSVQSHISTRTHPASLRDTTHQSVYLFHTGTCIRASARPSAYLIIRVSVRVSVLAAAYPYSALLGLRPAGGAEGPRCPALGASMSCPLGTECPVDRSHRRRGAPGSAGGAAAQGL